MKKENFIFFHWDKKEEIYLSKENEVKLVKTIKRKDIFQGKNLKTLEAKEEVNHVIELMNGNLLLLQIRGNIELFTPQGQLLKAIQLKGHILCGEEWKENSIICSDHNKIIFLNLNAKEDETLIEKEFYLRDDVINSIIHLYDDVFACGDKGQNFTIFNSKKEIIFQEYYDFQVSRLYKMMNDNILIPTVNGIIDIFNYKTKKVVKSLSSIDSTRNLWSCIELKNGNIFACSDNYVFIWKDGQFSTKRYPENVFIPSIELKEDNLILLIDVEDFILMDQNLEIVKKIPLFHEDMKNWKLIQLRNGRIIVVNYSNSIYIYMNK